MQSPARQHFIKHSAAAAARVDAGNAVRADATQYELHMAQLAEHKRRLKQIKSVERKVEFKAKILPEYEAYVDGVLVSGVAEQDDVLTTVMVWRIDAGDFDGALAIAGYVLEHKLQLPDQYQRDAPTVIAEEIAEHALADMAPENDAVINTVIAEQLEITANLVADCDMPDEVRAKLCKATGYALRDHAPAAALVQLERALQLNAKVGVKKDIERLQRALKNTQPAKERS